MNRQTGRRVKEKASFGFFFSVQDALIEKWMDRRTDGRTDGQCRGRPDEDMNRLANKCMDRWIDA